MDKTSLTLNPKEQINDEVTSTRNASPLGDKRDVAAMLKVSLRSVDNYIASGCPVIKPSPRLCRFDMADVMAWFKSQYSQQSRKGFSNN